MNRYPFAFNFFSFFHREVITIGLLIMDDRMLLAKRVGRSRSPFGMEYHIFVGSINDHRSRIFIVPFGRVERCKADYQQHTRCNL